MAEATFNLFSPPESRVLQRTLGLAAPGKPPLRLTEKHRPKALGDVVGQGAILFRLESFLEAPYSTAMIFEGPTGVGKTTIAKAMAAELGTCEFGDLRRSRAACRTRRLSCEPSGVSGSPP